MTKIIVAPIFTSPRILRLPCNSYNNHKVCSIIINVFNERLSLKELFMFLRFEDCDG